MVSGYDFVIKLYIFYMDINILIIWFKINFVYLFIFLCLYLFKLVVGVWLIMIIGKLKDKRKNCNNDK